MKHRLLSLALAGTGVACTLVAGQAPAAAGQGDPKKKQIAETECRDITEGTTARYDRDRVVSGLPDSYYETFESLKKDSGVATFEMVLSAPSCSHVTYALTVYSRYSDEQGRHPVLATASTVGDDESGKLTLTATVDQYPDDCLLLVGTTSAYGVLVDSAPDVGTWGTYDDVCDGGAPGLTYK